MRPWWGVGPSLALLLMLADVGAARAAWDNVFQACCASCGKAPAVSNYYAAPAAPSVSHYAPDSGCCAPACPPPPVCTTRYVQRCYYQPVTTYQSKSYYEAVTTYRTSYYYEPVTTYRYSCYVDPCTGCSQQVACPQTCYKLRSQCCPVQSWVQRCCQVPVQSYRIASYWEPVTSCCQPQTPCCPTSASAQPGVTVTPGTPAPAPAPAAPAPAVGEQRLTPQPGVNVVPNTGSGSPLYDRFYGPSNGSTPPSGSTGLQRQPNLLPPVKPAAAPLPPPPNVRLDRIVSLPQSNLEGRVVRNGDDAPRANAKLVFVNTAAAGARQQVTADAHGKFRVTLTSGAYLVYVNGTDNKPAFHSRINIGDNESRQVVLVSN